MVLGGSWLQSGQPLFFYGIIDASILVQMNNDYDREMTPKNHEEMKDAGYEMTGDGFWIPAEEEVEATGAESLQIIQNTKIVVLVSGERLISQVIESMDGSITLVEPRRLTVEATDGDTTTISFTRWIDLSLDSDVKINPASITTIVDPIPSLAESYYGEFSNGQ